MTPSAGFHVRDSAGEVVFNNRMWIMGGWYDSNTTTELRDVWNSEDGVNWTRVTERAPWTHPQHPVSLVFDNKMWMLGGFQGGRLPGGDQSNDVWWSTDGVSWTCACAAAPWKPRFSAGGAVFNGKMWILGGSQFVNGATNNTATAFNDVWNSSNGVNWIRVVEHAPWSARGYQRVLVYENKLWLLGGGNYRTPTDKIVANNDVWSSSDGVNWTRVAEHAQWSPRIWHEAIVYNDEIWILGGGSGVDAVVLNDAWHTRDGIHWTQAIDKNIWSPRHEMSVYNFQDKLWVVGGGIVTKPGTTNDVWQVGIASP
ncbi:MAG: hypothetical protein WD468_12910 [Pirellulales bacterium]